MSKSHALWLRWPWALPLLNHCSRIIWPNKASIRPFHLYYVWNNCLLSPPYCVAVETDEHLTAVGWGCHDNKTNPHCSVWWGGRFFFLFFLFHPSCTVTSAQHAVISQALWESGRFELYWLQGLPRPLQIRDFSWTRKSFKLVKDQRARSVKTSPEAALLPLFLLLVWSWVWNPHWEVKCCY